MDSETALYYMAQWDGHDGSLQSRLWWLQGTFNNVFFLSFHLSYLSTLSASTSKPMQACTVQGTCTFACIHLPATSARTEQRQRQSVHAKEIFLPCISQSLLTLTFFNLPTHAYICSHIHTQSTHSISRTPSTSIQRKTTWTKRSGFTLLEELEPLRVETEENYNI